MPRRSPIPRGFSRTEPISGWQIPGAGGSGSALTPSSPPSALGDLVAQGGLSLAMEGPAH